MEDGALFFVLSTKILDNLLRLVPVLPQQNQLFAVVLVQWPVVYRTIVRTIINNSGT